MGREWGAERSKRNFFLGLSSRKGKDRKSLDKVPGPPAQRALRRDALQLGRGGAVCGVQRGEALTCMGELGFGFRGQSTAVAVTESRV